MLLSQWNFNPRFPRGKRHLVPSEPAHKAISIHASRGGSDACEVNYWKHGYLFQSTLPAGEATPSIMQELLVVKFQSTLPAGEATIEARVISWLSHISIHASRGGSDVKNGPLSKRALIFQSTLPAGEATKRCRPLTPKRLISIHASRGGSDL